MTQRLPGIKEIGVLSWIDIPEDIVYKAEKNIVVNINANPSMIEFIGTPIATVEDIFDNNSSYQRAKLKFNTAKRLDFCMLNVVFVRDVNDQCWLLGDSYNRPVVQYNKTSGLPSGDSATYEYTLEMTAKKALIECNISA